MISFYLQGEPPHTTAQQKGVRVLKSRTTGKLRPMFFQKEKVREAEAWFVSRMAPFAPRTQSATVAFEAHVPLKLEVCFVFNWNKPELKKRAKGLLAECQWKTTPPDTDGSLKLCKDVLTAQGFWQDDAQVVEETTRKVFGDRPGVFVSISALKPYDAMPAVWHRATHHIMPVL